MNAASTPYFQKCTYKKSEFDDVWVVGIANVEAFDCNSVNYILDKNGNKVKSVYDFRLFPAYAGNLHYISLE